MGNTVTRSHIRDVDPGVGKATRANTKKNSTGFLHDHALANTSLLDSSALPPSHSAPIHLSVSSSRNLNSVYTHKTRQHKPLPNDEEASLPSFPNTLSPPPPSPAASQDHYSPTQSSADDLSLVSTNATRQRRPHRHHSIPNHSQSRPNFPENRHSFTYGSQRSFQHLAANATPEHHVQPQLNSQSIPSSAASAQKPPLPPSKLPISESSSTAVSNSKPPPPPSSRSAVRRKERHYGANISFSRNSSSQSAPSAMAPSASSSSHDPDEPLRLDNLHEHGRNSSLGSRTPPFAHRSPANIDPNLPGGTVYDCQTARTQTPPRVDKPPRARKVVSFNENVHVVTYPNEGSSTHSSTASDVHSSRYIETKQPKRRARAVFRLLSRVTGPLSHPEHAPYPTNIISTPNCFSASYDTCCGLRFGDDEAATDERAPVVLATRGPVERRGMQDRVSSFSFSKDSPKDENSPHDVESRSTSLEDPRYSLVDDHGPTGTVDDDFDYNERAPLDEDGDTLSLSDAHPSRDGIDEPEAIGDQLLSPRKEGKSDERVSSTFDIVPLWKRLKRVDELDVVKPSRVPLLRASEEKYSPRDANYPLQDSAEVPTQPSTTEKLSNVISLSRQASGKALPFPETDIALQDYAEVFEKSAMGEEPSREDGSGQDEGYHPAKDSDIDKKIVTEAFAPPSIEEQPGNVHISQEVTEKGPRRRESDIERQVSSEVTAPLSTGRNLAGTYSVSGHSCGEEQEHSAEQSVPPSESEGPTHVPPPKQVSEERDLSRLSEVNRQESPDEASEVLQVIADTRNQERASDEVFNSRTGINVVSEQIIPLSGSNGDGDVAGNVNVTDSEATAIQAVPSSLDVGSSPELRSVADPASDNDPLLAPDTPKIQDESRDEVPSTLAVANQDNLIQADARLAEPSAFSSGDRKVAEIVGDHPFEGKTERTLHRPIRTADSLLHEACQLEERLLAESRNSSIRLSEDNLELSSFPGNDTSDATLSEAIGSEGNRLSAKKESGLPSEGGIPGLDIDPICLSHDDYSVAACSPALSPLAGVYYGTNSPQGHGLGFAEDIATDITGIVDYPEYAVLRGQAIEDSVFGSEPNTPIMQSTSGWDEPFKEFDIGEEFREDSVPLRHVNYEDRLPKQSVPEVLLHDWSGSTPVEPNVEIVDSAPNSRSSITYIQNTSPRTIEPQKDIRNTALLLSARLNVDMSKMRPKSVIDRLSLPVDQEGIGISEVDGHIARDLSTVVGCADSSDAIDDESLDQDHNVMDIGERSEPNRSAQQEEDLFSTHPTADEEAGKASAAGDVTGMYFAPVAGLERADPKLRDFQRSVERKSFSEIGYRTIGLDNRNDSFIEGERGGEPASDFRTFSENPGRQDIQQRRLVPYRRRRLSNMEMGEGNQEGNNPFRSVMERLVNRMNLGKKFSVSE